jgi:DNA polymerase-3 subunit beta
MKLSIQREDLYQALQLIQPVVEKKSTVQILSNILCTVKGNELSLAATDLEVGIKINLPAQVETEGRITFSAKNFFEIVRELLNKPLRVAKKSNDWVEIICEKSRFNIVSLSAEDYPALPSFEEREYFDARADVLADMIDKTAFATSTDATRYHLNGVYFEKMENSILRMTATDGHRLSFIDQEVFKKQPEFKRGIIIPKKGLNEIRKLIEIQEEPGAEKNSVSLSFDRGYLFAKRGNTQLFVRLIEGEYPDYKPVIPTNTDKTVKLDREALTSALRRVSLLAHEKSRGVKLVIQNNLLVITSSNPDMGEAREELDVEFGGEALDIGFNAKYLLDCLPMIQSQKVELKFKDRLSPGILQGVDQRNHTYVIMPMRI